MKKPYNEQRLLEVMSRLDKTFKPKLNEWNFDKKKGEGKDDEEKETKKHEESETPKEEKAEHKGKKKWNFEKKEGEESLEHEEGESHEEEEKEHEDKRELDETKPKTKIPVNMIAKVGCKEGVEEKFVFGKGTKKRLFEVMQRVAPNFKTKTLNERFSTTFEYTKKLDFDDIYFLFDRSVADNLPDFSEIVFTVKANLEEVREVKNGTESTPETFLTATNIQLVEGSYKPEYKQYIEKWMEVNAHKFDEEIVTAYSNSQSNY